jgi:hypothetical protein
VIRNVHQEMRRSIFDTVFVEKKPNDIGGASTQRAQWRRLRRCCSYVQLWLAAVALLSIFIDGGGRRLQQPTLIVPT